MSHECIRLFNAGYLRKGLNVKVLSLFYFFLFFFFLLLAQRYFHKTVLILRRRGQIVNPLVLFCTRVSARHVFSGKYTLSGLINLYLVSFTFTRIRTTDYFIIWEDIIQFIHLNWTFSSKIRLGWTHILVYYIKGNRKCQKCQTVPMKRLKI